MTRKNLRKPSEGGAYTRFVKLAKVFLPVAALVIVGIVASRLSRNPLQEMTDIRRDEKTTPGQIEVVKAQYEGVDDKGRPYTLIAEKASRAVSAPDKVELYGLKADITLEDQSWIAVQAAKGIYDIKAEHMDFLGDVEVFHDSGYRMRLNDLAVDLATRHAVSKNPVRMQGPDGDIAAANIEVTDGGERIVFGGPATMTFFRLGRGGKG